MSLDHKSHELALLRGSLVKSYRRNFAFDDADVAVEDTSVAIDLGQPLPAGAIALAVLADNVDWTDGGAGTFAANVGDGTDDDKFTPTELDIDNGDARLDQQILVPAGGDQLTVTITGSVNLDTLTAGSLDLQVLYVVPDEKVV